MPKVPTPQQRDVIENRSGLFAVRACPGSGKTFVVAARLARLMKTWPQRHRGIAVLSFTNVAWQEIAAYLRDELEVSAPVRYPHFLGTIDSFINNFVFLPFGHLVMGCHRRPHLIGPPHDDYEPTEHGLYWGNAECNRKGCKLNDFSYDIEGNLINVRPRSHFGNCQSAHGPCARLKGQVRQGGYATQLDANYYAHAVLNNYPIIVRALAERFPLVMVDEAQDTSALQMGMLDLLIAQGLDELMLVGDPDQAIYQWRDAEPRLFIDKQSAWRDRSAVLTENWRSTTGICRFASVLAHSPSIMASADSKLSVVEEPPTIWPYRNEAELPAIVKRFTGECARRGIPVSDVGVLTRADDLLRTAFGAGDITTLDPWADGNRLGSALLQGKHLWEGGHYSESLRLVEREVCRRILSVGTVTREHFKTVHDQYGYATWRGGICGLVQTLPEARGPLPEWVRRACAVVAGHPLTHGWTIEIKKDRGQYRYSQISCGDLLAQRSVESENGEFAGTVHAAKGKTFESCLLILRARTVVGQYKNILASPINDSEELRIVYVAVTRPRQFLSLAVPQAEVPLWTALVTRSAETAARDR